MSRVPPDLRPLLALVREAAASCALRGRYEPLRGGNAALRGQCENAAALFHLLAGGTAAGWRMMRIGPEAWRLGPHYFVRHVSGAVVDPTADQFPPGERVPYALARGQSAGGFRRVPPGARVGSVDLAGQTATPEALRAALRLPSASAAGAASLARRWAARQGAPTRPKANGTKRLAGPPRPTDLNLWVLAQTFAPNGVLHTRVQNRLRPTELPHLRRCMQAGLLRPDGADLALTPEGEAAVADHLLRNPPRQA